MTGTLCRLSLIFGQAHSIPVITVILILSQGNKSVPRARVHKVFQGRKDHCCTILALSTAL
uniref:Uncharacterized protein n=1 Tax=Anguilla anguilla TaxID=7936 RepID=A0A0E9Y163_ANGAN